jgi:hypothetical protein
MKKYIKNKIFGWIMGIILLIVIGIILYAKYGA